MTPKQREAIERHGRQVLALFPNATERDPEELCRKLRSKEWPIATRSAAARPCIAASPNY